MNIGIAKVNFTPPVGLPLMGNLRKDYASKGVHDPLYAKAIVFADSNGMKSALLSLDICMLSREQVSIMREQIAGECDIPYDNILIAATHSHSGPATMKIYTCPKADEQDIRMFLKKAAQAVTEANRNLQKGKLRIGYAEENTISFYRRIRGKDGKCYMNWEAIDPELDEGPLGEIDPQIISLAIERNGVHEAVLVNFALHPAIIDYANDLYSADYPGYLAEAMRRIEGEQFETLFFNGCCGNINHINHRDPHAARRGFEHAQRTGAVLATGVKQAMNKTTDINDTQIIVSKELVKLKRLSISEEKYQWSLDTVEKMKKNPLPGIEDGLPEEYSAETWIGMHKVQDEDDHVEVMVIRIGSVAIVGIPGEAFCELGKQIKTESPAAHTIVIELANDAIGYLPTIEAFEQGGGYESQLERQDMKKMQGKG